MSDTPTSSGPQVTWREQLSTVLDVLAVLAVAVFAWLVFPPALLLVAAAVALETSRQLTR